MDAIVSTSHRHQQSGDQHRCGNDRGGVQADDCADQPQGSGRPTRPTIGKCALLEQTAAAAYRGVTRGRNGREDEYRGQRRQPRDRRYLSKTQSQAHPADEHDRRRCVSSLHLTGQGLAEPAAPSRDCAITDR